MCLVFWLNTCIIIFLYIKCIDFRFWMMPALFLKKMVMGNFDKGLVDPDIADSIDFLVERVCMMFA